MLANSLCKCGIVLLLGCGPTSSVPFGHRWDLSRPILVQLQEDFPKATAFKSALESAISQTQGSIGVSNQVLTLFGTDGDISNKSNLCTDPSVRAYANLQDGRISIAICKTKAANTAYTPYEIQDTMRHEWGHTAANRADHLECLDSMGKPLGNIMGKDPSCHPGVDQYSVQDINYICSTGNTVGGSCS